MYMITDVFHTCIHYTCLYYDGNNGIWYSYDHQSQQYVPCNNDQNDNKKEKEPSNTRKVVISAPAATTTTANSLADAVQAAAPKCCGIGASRSLWALSRIFGGELR